MISLGPMAVQPKTKTAEKVGATGALFFAIPSLTVVAVSWYHLGPWQITGILLLVAVTAVFLHRRIASYYENACLSIHQYAITTWFFNDLPVEEKRRWLTQVMEPLAESSPLIAKVARGEFTPTPYNTFFFGKNAEPHLGPATGAEEVQAILRDLFAEIDQLTEQSDGAEKHD